MRRKVKPYRLARVGLAICLAFLNQSRVWFYSFYCYRFKSDIYHMRPLRVNAALPRAYINPYWRNYRYAKLNFFCLYLHPTYIIALSDDYLSYLLHA